MPCITDVSTCVCGVTICTDQVHEQADWNALFAALKKLYADQAEGLLLRRLARAGPKCMQHIFLKYLVAPPTVVDPSWSGTNSCVLHLEDAPKGSSLR